jgi:uncharacterized protein YjiS (DUF1127 family)
MATIPIARDTSRLSVIVDALTTLARSVREVPAALANRDQLRRLAEQDDHALSDIGLAREDIAAALSGPFWRDPSEQLVRLRELKADPCRTVGETARERGLPVTSPELILAACNRRRLPLAPLNLPAASQ